MKRTACTRVAFATLCAYACHSPETVPINLDAGAPVQDLTEISPPPPPRRVGPLYTVSALAEIWNRHHKPTEIPDDCLSAGGARCWIKPGDKLRNGDRLSLFFQVHEPAYLYVAQASSRTAARWISASEEPTTPTDGLGMRIPQDPDQWLEPDLRGRGLESLMVFASRRPLEVAEREEIKQQSVMDIFPANTRRCARHNKAHQCLPPARDLRNTKGGPPAMTPVPQGADDVQPIYFLYDHVR